MKKQYNIDSFDEELKSTIDNLDHHAKIVQTKGVLGGKQVEPVPLFDRAESEKVISGMNNNWIVLGRDRPASRFSGYGGQGATQAGMIDLCVGRMSSAIDGPQPDVYAAPNFFTDAARIYISQKTDIDDNFALAPGSVGMKKNVSGVGIKADEVRLVGRTGIKIVTGQGRGISAGKHGEKTAHGGRIEVIPTIDLIAGNDTESVGGIQKLQPLVKGRNLIDCLNDIIQQINDLHSVVYNMNQIQKRFQNALKFHTHISTAPGAPTAPSVIVNLAGIRSDIDNLIKVLIPAIGHRVNGEFLKKLYLSEGGSKYICSRHVNTT